MTDTPKTALEMMQGPTRTYIQRIRNDPRTRAMHDGWVAQACAEAEQVYPDPSDDRRRTHHAASRALELALSFVLDNDGELTMVREQLDRVLENSITLANMSPRSFVMPKAEQ